VAKHCGRATQVDVTLTFASGSASLRVEDHGRGFLLPTDGAELAREGHFGLENMRERAAKVGGRIDLSSTPGRGTRVELTVNAGEEQPR
jgi:signal transduction histidine kinase